MSCRPAKQRFKPLPLRGAAAVWHCSCGLCGSAHKRTRCPLRQSASLTHMAPDSASTAWRMQCRQLSPHHPGLGRGAWTLRPAACCPSRHTQACPRSTDQVCVTNAGTADELPSWAKLSSWANAETRYGSGAYTLCSRSESLHRPSPLLRRMHEGAHILLHRFAMGNQQRNSMDTVQWKELHSCSGRVGKFPRLCDRVTQRPQTCACRQHACAHSPCTWCRFVQCSPHPCAGVGVTGAAGRATSTARPARAPPGPMARLFAARQRPHATRCLPPS